MDYLISMYIDNELSFDDKMAFIEHVHADQRFTNEALSLLRQEKVLHGSMAEQVPEVALPFSRRLASLFEVARPVGLAIAASLLLLVALNFLNTNQPLTDLHINPAAYPHRFVIYQTGVKQIEIVGSFTNWQPVPLSPAGSNGYWEITMEIPPGEHAFSYILDGNNIMADPTISAQEKDDFGTNNSILIVRTS